MLELMSPEVHRMLLCFAPEVRRTLLELEVRRTLRRDYSILLEVRCTSIERLVDTAGGAAYVDGNRGDVAGGALYPIDGGPEVIFSGFFFELQSGCCSVELRGCGG